MKYVDKIPEPESRKGGFSHVTHLEPDQSNNLYLIYHYRDLGKYSERYIKEFTKFKKAVKLNNQIDTCIYIIFGIALVVLTLTTILALDPHSKHEDYVWRDEVCIRFHVTEDD